MNIVRVLSRGISGKAALIVLTVVISVHLALMYFYVQNNRIVQRAVYRDEMIQKIINALYLVEVMPEASRQNAISAMVDPSLSVSLSSQPQWPMRFDHISYWKISRTLRGKLNSFAASFKLGKNQWLNLQAKLNVAKIFQQLLLMSVEIFVLVVILIAGWSVNRFTRPLQHFKRAAKNLSIDLHSNPINIDGPSVVRETAAAMNEMQKRIQKLIQDRTQILAAISHDLRTPITRMKLRSQFINDAGLMKDYMRDLSEMEEMIKETLSFARNDAEKENKRNLDLVSLLEVVCSDAVDMGHKVNFQSRIQRVSILGRPLALKRAFTNIIHNGIRYANVVNVVLSLKQQFILVRIEDDGPGIPEEDFERVFAPFYRREQSRSRDTGGVGLGLAVTRHIIEAHGGKVLLANRRPRGLRVTVELPNHSS